MRTWREFMPTSGSGAWSRKRSRGEDLDGVAEDLLAVAVRGPNSAKRNGPGIPCSIRAWSGSARSHRKWKVATAGTERGDRAKARGGRSGQRGRRGGWPGRRGRLGSSAPRG